MVKIASIFRWRNISRYRILLFAFLGVACLSLFHRFRLLSTESTSANVHRPFNMPMYGKKYSIYQPVYDMDLSKLGKTLFASTGDFIDTYSERIEWLDTQAPLNQNRTVIDRAQEMYLEMIKGLVSGTSFNDAEKSVSPEPTFKTIRPFNLKARQWGMDWAYLGDTMTGWKRLDNIRKLLKSVVEDTIPGDYIETGVWRGGASVYARAVLDVLGQTDRLSYVCDSFAGLPPGDRSLDIKDKNWNLMHWYLAVSDDVVARNFQKFGFLNSNVIFAKGFFNETMPHLKKKSNHFSVMRLDGDMYESTVDVLYNLYDKLSIGGYVIMDDWYGFPSKTACEDFFKVHGIEPEIIQIDKLSAYWKKTVEVDIQYWRYEQNQFKK